MVETATPTITARKAPRAPDRDPWIGAGRALAGEIWGVNYVGTAPSYGVPVTGGRGVLPEPIQDRGIVWVIRGAGQTTAPVWPSGAQDPYWATFRPVTSEIGVTVWGGEYVISVPTRLTVPAPELAFWASEGFGASSILIVGEAQLTYTDPADSSHLPMWRRIFESRQAPASIPSDAELEKAARDPHAELRMLAESTRLPVEQLGEALGASRRTIYNWLAGRPIGDEARARIFRLRDALDLVVRTRDPALVRDWLAQGHPTPAKLAADERWEELDARVRQETEPLRSVDEPLDQERGEPLGDTPGVLAAALLAFSTPQERPGSQRVQWKPRELTGIASEDEEAPE
jgi:hypothetical protein